MFKHLGILLLIIEVDWLEGFRTGDWFGEERVFVVTVGFTYCYLVHDTTHLLLGISDLVKSNCENTTFLWELIAFGADFKEFVGIVKFLGGQEGFEDDASFSVATEGGT